MENKIVVHIKTFFEGHDPISRSKGRQLCQMFEGHNDILLDFEGVTEIGHSFYHEVFIVWHRYRHSNVTLNYCNAGDKVNFMIGMTLNTEYAGDKLEMHKAILQGKAESDDGQLVNGPSAMAEIKKKYILVEQ